MQLKPLEKGRFHALWQQEHDAIEQIMRECITETKTVPAQYKLMQQGQQVTDLYLVPNGRISMGYTALVRWSFLPITYVSWILLPKSR